MQNFGGGFFLKLVLLVSAYSIVTGGRGANRTSTPLQKSSFFPQIIVTFYYSVADPYWFHCGSGSRILVKGDPVPDSGF
jgi:hypothetical protein